MRYIVDTETNGLLDTLDTIHCLVAHDLDSDKVISAHGKDVKAALVELERADLLVMHNAISFDMPALKKVYPKFAPRGELRDTLVMSRLIFADLKERDFAFRRRHRSFPGNLIGSHSLEAWGHRLGLHKGDYAKEMKAAGKDPWAEWNEDMQRYCELDVAVTVKLWNRLAVEKFSEQSIQLEHDVARIIRRQELYGFLFDKEAAVKLEGKLRVRHAEIAQELATAFPPWEVNDGRPFTPKRDNKRLGYTKGVPVQKRKMEVFNPASRDHIAARLTSKYAWKPAQFTDGGKPAIDESVLAALKFPEAAVLSEHLLIEKRLGQIADGAQAWLKCIKDDGRIHGRVNTNGARTGRMTHSNPNVAQVPAVRSPYGSECRALFTVPVDKVLVGADASGLELRMLAHYLAKWDDGAYAKVILEGDIHSHNQQAAGLPTRDQAKTLIYAVAYGAGAAKVGTIIGKGAKAGGQLKQRFLDNIPGFTNLLAAIGKASERGYLVGLDGRKLPVPSAHSALNTLLQSAGAVLMKRALVLADASLRSAGLTPGIEYEYVANIHDEVQVECDQQVSELVGSTLVRSIEQAGESFRLRCPTTGEWKQGRSWKDCH